LNANHPDYYEILQPSPDAEQEVIEAAYRRLARKYHPDVSKDPGASDRMRLLNQAFEVLGDPATRAAYDRSRTPKRNPHSYRVFKPPANAL
jgi:curved DNA-binding protein